MSVLSGAARVEGGERLARHLAAGPGGALLSRGLASGTIAEAQAELSAGSMPTRTRRPLWHCHCDPAHADPRIRPLFWQVMEAEFGLEQARYFGREHKKGTRPDHEHRVYDVTRPDGSVINLKFDRMRREKVAVIVAYTLKLPFPPVPHTRAIARALRSDGRQDIARWVDSQAAGPIPIAVTTPEDRQHEERTGRSRAEAETAALAAWQASDTGPALQHALAARGLILADGGKVPVILDGGATWPLARLLGAASRREGTRIDAATVRRRLAGLTLTPADRARPPEPPPLDMAAIGKRLAELRAAKVRAEAEAAALAWIEPPETVTAVLAKASSREADEAAQLGRRDRAHQAVEAVRRTMPMTTVGRLIDGLRWRRSAARRQALAEAEARARQAEQEHATAGLLASAARRRATDAESGWREGVEAEAAQLSRRAAWLAAAIAAIERIPALGLASDDGLSIAVRQARRPPAPSTPPPPVRRFDRPAPAYRPR